MACLASRSVASPQSVPGSVRGRVHIAEKPDAVIADAEITLGDATVRTDALGKFVLPGVPVGAHTLRARRVGFGSRTISVSVSAGRDTEIVIALAPGAELLSQVTINGVNVMVPVRLADPYQRMARGVGWYFGRGLIDSLHPYDVKSLLPIVPGAHVNDRGVEFARCASGAALGTPGHVQVYVDGTRLTNYSSPLAGRTVNDALRTVPMASIELIEVYQGIARIPAAYLDDACAVILIWTR
jgi:hypothetical protein